MSYHLPDLKLPTQKQLLQIAVFTIVVLALLLGYYATTYQSLIQRYDRKEKDFKRLQRYIGTDKSLEILKKE